MHYTMVNLNIGTENVDIFDITKYSNYDKVIKITSLCFKLICNKTKEDPLKKALLDWLRQMQSQYFSKEIEYLKSDKKEDCVPQLANNLNLFLDSNNLLRSKAG